MSVLEEDGSRYKRLREDSSESDRGGNEKKHRKEEKRPKQWQVVKSSDSEDEDDKDNGKSVQSESSSSSNSSGSSSSTESKEKKHKKHHKYSKKAKKSQSSSKKHKKDKKDKKDKKKKHKKEHKSSSSSKYRSIDQNEYGKYGIIREEHFFQKQREFELYMEEVKGIPGVLYMNKREMMDHFKSYIEDYNTATLPHEKYYHLEAYERKHYQNPSSSSSNPPLLSDEAIKAYEQKLMKTQQSMQEFNAMRLTLQRDAQKREEMKSQASLYTELQLAYKRGDSQTVKRLERLLQPDEETKK